MPPPDMSAADLNQKIIEFIEEQKIKVDDKTKEILFVRPESTVIGAESMNTVTTGTSGIPIGEEFDARADQDLFIVEKDRLEELFAAFTKIDDSCISINLNFSDKETITITPNILISNEYLSKLRDGFFNSLVEEGRFYKKIISKIVYKFPEEE